MADPVGWMVVHVDEDGEVAESLSPVEDNHLLLMSRQGAVELRADRDPEWWRLASIHLDTEEAEGA